MKIYYFVSDKPALMRALRAAAHDGVAGRIGANSFGSYALYVLLSIQYNTILYIYIIFVFKIHILFCNIYI